MTKTTTRKQAILQGASTMTALAGAHSLQAAYQNPLQAKVGHFPGKAKNIILFHMVGAPSQLELFCHKPMLDKYHGKLCPNEFIEGKRFAFLRGHPQILGTQFKFKKMGEAGHNLSELLPNIGGVSENISFINSMHTEDFNHGPAQMKVHTGLNRLGYPSMGAWLNYGLGSVNQSMPGFVVFITGRVPGAGSSLWNNGFLPSIYQGIELRSQGDPVLFLKDPKGIDRNHRRRMIDRIQKMNDLLKQESGDPEIDTRKAQYELAYRMQASIPELTDLSKESKSTLEMYGKGTFAEQCLKARRLVERGVRIVELYNQGWDTHNNIKGSLPRLCKAVDQPIAALIQDLKQRGLLDETLIVWMAEFGRTPMMQGVNPENNKKVSPGRDHHRDAFTCWMAGGGIKGGLSYGETDEFGYSVTKNPVAINDFHATIMHLMGIDHERLNYPFQGLDLGLTGVEESHILYDLIA